MRITAIYEDGFIENITLGKGLNFEDAQKFMIGKQFFVDFAYRTCLSIKIIEE